MAKKAKPSVEKIVKKVNKEFEKTSARIEGLINDALGQFDTLQSQIQEPVRKLLKDMDELRDREMKRFNDEFERRMDEFQELQSALLERLGVAPIKTGKGAESTAAEKPAQEKLTAASKTSQAAPSGKAKTSKTTKASGNKAAKPAKATPKTKKPVDKSDLTRVKGIGPATAKKMQGAGITSIEQIANPTEADLKLLQNFKSMKGFKDLTTEAQKVL